MKMQPIPMCVAAMAMCLTLSCHNSGATHHDHDGDDHHEEQADAHGLHPSDDIHFTPAQAKACGLKVETVAPSAFAEVVEATGRVLPAQGEEATVTATMAGIVSLSDSHLTEGAAVGAGRTLFVVSAKAMADGNPAAVAQSEAHQARQAYERAQKLAADHIVSQRELEEARQRYEAAAATAKSLGGAAQTRGIAAPISGYVKSILVKPGDYVQAGQALATVTQSRHLQLRADVPERQFGFLAHVRTAHFRLAYDNARRVYALDELGGRLLSKGKASSSTECFVPVTFEFNNTGDIIPGTFAEVYLQGAPRQGVISVPDEAVSEQQGLYFVYVQTHADAYRRVEVTTGANDGRRIEIVRGLKAGDKVVTHGTTQVRLAASAGAVPEGHHH